LARRSLFKGSGGFSAPAAIDDIPLVFFAGDRVARFPKKADRIRLTSQSCNWDPEDLGKYTLMVEVINSTGASQPFKGSDTRPGICGAGLKKTEARSVIGPAALFNCGPCCAQEKKIGQITLAGIHTKPSPAEGRKKTATLCSRCHSLYYIIMQTNGSKTR